MANCKRDYRPKKRIVQKINSRRNRHSNKVIEKKSKPIPKSYSVKSETRITKHHRRPRTIGGSTKPSNISFVTERIHKNWHKVFGNLNAEQIGNVININFKPKRVTVICIFINGSQCTKQGDNDSKTNDFDKIMLAWNSLFEKSLNFSQKIEYINNVLLDPAYHLYVID